MSVKVNSTYDIASDYIAAMGLLTPSSAARLFVGMLDARIGWTQVGSLLRHDTGASVWIGGGPYSLGVGTEAGRWAKRADHFDQAIPLGFSDKLRIWRAWQRWAAAMIPPAPAVEPLRGLAAATERYYEAHADGALTR